jgi:hypothetical protein
MIERKLSWILSMADAWRESIGGYPTTLIEISSHGYVS